MNDIITINISSTTATLCTKWDPKAINNVFDWAKENGYGQVLRIYKCEHIKDRWHYKIMRLEE